MMYPAHEMNHRQFQVFRFEGSGMTVGQPHISQSLKASDLMFTLKHEGNKIEEKINIQRANDTQKWYADRVQLSTGE